MWASHSHVECPRIRLCVRKSEEEHCFKRWLSKLNLEATWWSRDVFRIAALKPVTERHGWGLSSKDRNEFKAGLVNPMFSAKVGKISQHVNSVLDFFSGNSLTSGNSQASPGIPTKSVKISAQNNRLSKIQRRFAKVRKIQRAAICTIFCKIVQISANFEIGAVQKCANPVDFEKMNAAK